VLGLISLIIYFGHLARQARRAAESNMQQASSVQGSITTTGSVRRLIVSTFETVCIALVLIPTGLAVLALGFGERPLAGFVVAGLTFIVTAFLAGGALTLVSIANNTQALVQIFQRMEKTELRAIADDVHRIEGVGRDARNQAAVSAAISQSSATAT
jgi:hypothetical protein